MNIGGPSWVKKTCKACGEEWVRYVSGSHDWKYEDCPKCKADKEIKRPRVETEK